MDQESQQDATQDPVTVIERALMTMRRDQQSRRLQRGRGRGPDGFAGFGGPGGPGGTHGRHGGPKHGIHGPDRSLGGAARFRMLDALEGGARTVSDLADATGVDQPRASRLVSDAAERGLLRRGVDPNDARRAVIELTEAGRAHLADAHQTRRAAVEAALAGFTA
ncbi:MAG: MarR family winged helix-turn-helix transcriptional regulator, partial [Pseudolysinimonas sp.]